MSIFRIKTSSACFLITEQSSARPNSRLIRSPIFRLLSGLILTVSQTTQAIESPDYTTMDLEQLLDVDIVTASKYSQKQSQSPSAVTVIDKHQIKQFGHRTLGDVLRTVPGFFVVNNRIYENAGVRGFDQADDYNGRILIMIDGIRINENIYDSGLTGNELPIDIDLVERIEVVRGPGSSMYGSNAFFAVINLITRNGQDFKGGEAAGSWASFDTFKGRFSYGQKHDNGLEYLVSGSGFGSQGPTLSFPDRASAENPNGLTKTNDDRGQQVFTKARWGDFSFEGGYGTRKRNFGTGAYYTDFDDGSTFAQDSEAFFNLQYATFLSPKLELTARAFYGDYSYDSGYQFAGVTNKTQAHGWWTGFESRLISTHFEQHKLIAGIEVQENWLQKQTNYDVDPYRLYSQDERDTHRIGIYLQDDISITEQLNLSVGARMDDYSNASKLLFSPRLGLVYQVLPDTLLRAQYSHAFRAPNVSQQYDEFAPAYSDQDQDGTPETLDFLGFRANPDLEPELVETYELGLEQTIAKYWRFNATGYFMEVEKRLDYERYNAIYYQYGNSTDQYGYGGEFEIRRQWENGLSLRTGYSLQFAEDVDGNSINYVPRHLYQLNLMTPLFFPEWHSGLEMQALSGRQTQSGQLPSYTRMNLSVLYQPIKSLDLSATLYDVFDNYLYDPGDDENQAREPQDGRSFRLKLEYRF
jgi:iron complex outermembrane receptor protein